MANPLAGKVAIVTGGGIGIGEAICKLFAREGAAVVVAGLPDDPVRPVVNDIVEAGGRTVGYLGDIPVRDNAQVCVKLAIDEYGQLNMLINNAGVYPEVNYLTDY